MCKETEPHATNQVPGAVAEKNVKRYLFRSFGLAYAPKPGDTARKLFFVPLTLTRLSAIPLLFLLLKLL